MNTIHFNAKTTKSIINMVRSFDELGLSHYEQLGLLTESLIETLEDIEAQGRSVPNEVIDRTFIHLLKKVIFVRDKTIIL